jgi:hypothetical protein
MPKKPPDLTKDARVVEMAKCICFAIHNMKNKTVMDWETNTMTTWHAWFKDALKEAGFSTE